MSVDLLQSTEEALEQERQEAEAAAREGLMVELRRPALADTAEKPRRIVTAPLSAVRSMTNMRTGRLPRVEELAISIKQLGQISPPTVRETGDADKPYELVAGARRLAAMALIDRTDGVRDDWQFSVAEGISDREALSIMCSENFSQEKPEPIEFARQIRRILAKDKTLTAAEVARSVGAPVGWTQQALRMLDLPEQILERVQAGDLSFTAADFVRKGLAKGTLSEEEAVALAGRHADGEISTSELKQTAGYVPPAPENYDQLSRELDEARWAAADRKRERVDDEDDDDKDDDVRASGSSASAPASERPGAPRLADGPSKLDLERYLVGALLRGEPPQHRARIGAGTGDPFAYAARLTHGDLLAVMHRIALRMLDEDPNPPRAIFG